MKEYMKNIGKTCKYYLAGKNCFIYCFINDVRNSFGRIEYKIEPLKGEGYIWTYESNITIEDPLII